MQNANRVYPRPAEPSTTLTNPVAVRTDATYPWLHHGRIPSLDGLRGVALLLVLVAHSHSTTGFPQVSNLMHGVLGWGRIGVDFFFVISGFLITTLMLREFDRSGQMSVRNFYARRVLRIIPAYAAYLVFLALLQSVGSAALTRGDWLAALTYTVNFRAGRGWEIGHLWSLSIEEHFYLMWPVLVVACRPRSIIPLTVGAIAGCLLVRAACLAGGVEGFGKWTFTRLDTIAFGCLAASAARTAGRGTLHRLCSRWWALPCLLACVLAVQIASLLSYRLEMTFGFPARAAVLTLIMWAAIIRNDGALFRLLNARGLVVIGTLSYSLYLWQQLFLYPHATGMLRTFPLNILAAFAAATLSYQLVEKPFLSLRHRFSSAGPRAATPPEPVVGETTA